MKVKISLILYLICLLPNVSYSLIEEYGLERVLQLAEANSPQLSVAKFQEIAALKNVDIAKANYYPSLKAESIYTKGFPGSSSLLRIGGLIGSPFRSGLGAGLVAEQVILDFGRTYHAVQAAKYQTEVIKQNTKITAYEIKQLALQTYYDCSLAKSQHELWEYLENEADIITQQVEYFVNTGQRSIVDGYLSRAQRQEAISTIAYYNELFKQNLRALLVIMGIGNIEFTCARLNKKFITNLPSSDIGIENSPLLNRALVDAKVANERLKQEKAGLYPEITAIASYGYMDKARLVQKQDYAVGIGLKFPLIDLNIRGRIGRAHAESLAKTENIAAEMQLLQEANAQYDEIIQSSKTLLSYLDRENKIANDAFEVAKRRYFALEGDLLDLREAYRNLTRVRIEILNAQARLLQSNGLKILLNGGTI